MWLLDIMPNIFWPTGKRFYTWWYSDLLKLDSALQGLTARISKGFNNKEIYSPYSSLLQASPMLYVLSLEAAALLVAVLWHHPSQQSCMHMRSLRALSTAQNVGQQGKAPAAGEATWPIRIALISPRRPKERRVALSNSWTRALAAKAVTAHHP